MFRVLAEEEEATFRSWAREHYVPYSPIKSVWHPCVQDECVKINVETDASRNYAVSTLKEEQRQ